MKIFTQSIAFLSIFALLQGPAPAQESKPPTAPSEKKSEQKAPVEAERKTLSKLQKDEILIGVNRIITKTAYVPGIDFSKWEEFIAGKQEAIDKAETNGEFVRAINEALRRFGASHIAVSSPEAVKAMRERKVVGIGIRPKIEENGVRLMYVFPDSPAGKAGLAPGDLVLEVDGKKATTIGQFSGEEGTTLKLKVQKFEGQVTELELKRAVFSTNEPETLKWSDPETAVIRVPSFMFYNRERVETIMEEATAKAKLIIVDLRGNGGGQVMALLHLTGMLVPEGSKLGTFINRKIVDDYKKATNKDGNDLKDIAEWTDSKVRPFGNKKVKPYTGNVAVLIDGGSGSASEMFAAGMRELRNAPLIGSKSAGAVLASVLLPLSHGFQMQVPITDYLTIKGVRLEGNGLVPDVPAKYPEGPRAQDPGVDAAVAWYKNAANKSSEPAKTPSKS